MRLLLAHAQVFHKDTLCTRHNAHFFHFGSELLVFPVKTLPAVLRGDEQVKHLGIEMTLQHPRLGALNVVRAPMQIGGVDCAKNPTPERGEHTDAVLAEFGFSAEEIAALKVAKAV